MGGVGGVWPPRSSMRSHPLPSRGGVRGGVCNVSNILSAKEFQRRSFSEGVSAKRGLRRWGAKELGTKRRRHRKLPTLQTPPLTPPRKGRVQEGMAAHKSFLQRVNCYIIAFFYDYPHVATRWARRSKVPKGRRKTMVRTNRPGRGHRPWGLREALPSLQGEGLGVGSVMSVISYAAPSSSPTPSLKILRPQLLRPKLLRPPPSQPPLR